MCSSPTSGSVACSARRIAAHHLLRAVDHQLRRIRTIQTKPVGIPCLPRREHLLRERVGPAILVPVRDMLTEADDLHPCKRAPVELPQQIVRRRAARTSFRSKQLEQRHAPYGCLRQSGCLRRRRRAAHATDNAAADHKCRNNSASNPHRSHRISWTHGPRFRHGLHSQSNRPARRTPRQRLLPIIDSNTRSSPAIQIHRQRQIIHSNSRSSPATEP
jgi:hypothetical protein